MSYMNPIDVFTDMRMAGIWDWPIFSKFKHYYDWIKEGIKTKRPLKDWLKVITPFVLKVLARFIPELRPLLT